VPFFYQGIELTVHWITLRTCPEASGKDVGFVKDGLHFTGIVVKDMPAKWKLWF
jgi:hypothetical protein